MLDKQFPVVHSNGINKDRSFQDSNDVTFALNAIRDNHEGGRQEYQSEPGNELSASLPTGYILLGSIYGQDEEIYLLSTNNASSEIGLFKQGRYQTLANLNLGFSTEHPPTGEYRVRNGCERIIYWGDKHNPDYWFNVDKPNDFKTSGVFDANKFKFVPNIQCPKIDLIQVNSSGGNLSLGSYYFQLEVVDVDGNSIYKTDISPQTIIYDDDQTDAYNNIDGGLNAPQYDSGIGGVPITNKSITLRFYNLDTSFDYLKVNVVKQIVGTQVIEAHSVGQLVPITGTEFQWTYTGYNPSGGDIPLDYSSLVIPDVKYKKSYVQEQVQGRLVRANVEQDRVDYSTYQRFASLITAKWVAKEVKTDDQFDLGNPKNPNTYWDCTSFQGDEVYAFTIQYLLKNGDWTPCFQLIGRPSVPSDLTVLTVVSNASVLGTNDVWESDVEHLGLTIGQTVPKWKVFNTASITTSNTVAHPYTYEGEFGFYQSDNTTYPDLSNCDGDNIFGEDSNGTPITTITKLRFFRFPDRRLIPHVTGTNGEYIQPLGVKFDNITYPSTDVVGHRFCHAVRDAANKTVVDSGWACQPSIIVTGVGNRLYLDANFTDFDLVSTNGYVRYNSANILYNQKLFNPDYIKLNQAYHIESSPDSEETIVTKTGGTDTITAYSYIFNITDIALPTRSNYLVSNQIYVPANSYTPASLFDMPIQSADDSVDDSIIKIGSYPLEDASTLLAGNVLGGANVTDPVTGTLEYNSFYVYKKVNIQPYENILNLNYNYIHFNHAVIADDNEFYGGDTIISLNTQTRTFWPLFTPDNILQGLCYTTFYEEHDINTSLRHGGTGEATKYYGPGSDIAVLLEKFAELESDGKYTIRPTNEIIKDYFAINKDYDVQSTEVGKVSLPLNYDYCTDCLAEYPNRIIFSPQSFEEESFDLYRINKINDYIDLPAHRGAITGLKYQNNQLLVHTEDTTFILQPNPQQIATDQNTAYLTTGDFLSIPPQELMQTDVGMGGLQNKQSQCDTPFGHFWADQKRGEIFGFDNKLEVLSNKGLNQWFKEYLPSEATSNFFAVTNEKFPINSTLDRKGVGIILYYDPRFKRLMITKKDYLPLDHKEESIDLGPISTFWSDLNNRWEKLNGASLVEVYPDDSTYFEKKSWTLSYSFKDQSFTSWHSYIPRIAFNDSNNFYTCGFNSSSNGIFKHLDKTKYQNYFGSKYDFIIEWSNFDPVSSNVSNLYYVGYTHVWDSLSKQFKTVDATFDKCLVYNFEQSTGLQTLVLQDQHISPYLNNKIPKVSKYVVRTDQNYKIAGLSDLAINQPVVTKDWSSVKLYNGYIDQVSNAASINSNKSVYDWGNIWDKFVFVRLFFNPLLDYRKTVILQVLNNQQSIR